MECSDVRAGSILVTVRGSVADLAAAVKDVRDNGLDLKSFDALTAIPGKCVCVCVCVCVSKRTA